MPGMDKENSSSDNKLSKSNSNESTNDMSVNLASFLKTLSQNSVSISDTSVTSISELSLDIDNFEHRNIQRSKSEANEFYDVRSESFLSQIANSDRILNIDYINGKLNKSQYDIDINRSLQNVNLISRLTNTKFSNIDALSSMQLQNISAIKSLLENQNGQIYLLVKSDSLQHMDSSNGFTNLLNSNNYSHQMQCSPSDVAVQQLKIPNNLSTAELIQKILESPQSTTSNNNLESIITNGKIDESSISNLVQTYRDSLNSDIINNYYDCSLDSNNEEPEVTLLVDDENSISTNSQFPINSQNQSIKQEKQILILKRHSDVEVLPSIGRFVNQPEKEQLNLFSDQTSNIETNTDIYNDIANNFLQSSSAIFRKNSSKNKHQKQLKMKQCKPDVEIPEKSDCTFKIYPSNSTAYSNELSTSQVDSKDYFNSGDEFKELKRKSSHNEVERRRRDRINTWINELQNMLPANEKVALNRSKSHILKSVYDYFRIQTNQFNDIQAKYEKLCTENREKSEMIKTLEDEKEVLLNQLQYINQAVTSTVKSTQQSLIRANVNNYQEICSEKVKVNQPYRITNLYSNSDVNNFPNTAFVVDDNNQSKKRKLNPNNTA